MEPKQIAHGYIIVSLVEDDDINMEREDHAYIRWYAFAEFWEGFPVRISYRIECPTDLTKKYGFSCDEWIEHFADHYDAATGQTLDAHLVSVKFYDRQVAR